MGMSKNVTGLAVAVALFNVVVWAPAAAQEKAVAAVPGSAVSSPFGEKALDQKVLARQRGGTDPGVLNDLKLNGVVSDNRASNLVTGNNIISDGALSGASGVPLVVQNSGNNVLIQSATIINVQVK